MEQKTFSHDGLDAFVATVLGWWRQLLQKQPGTPEELHDVAFSDEWERKQIARELHWN